MEGDEDENENDKDYRENKKQKKKQRRWNQRRRELLNPHFINPLVIKRESYRDTLLIRNISQKFRYKGVD